MLPSRDFSLLAKPSYSFVGSSDAELKPLREEADVLREEAAGLRALLRGDRACSGALSAELDARRYAAPAVRTPAQTAACEDRLFRVLGIVGGLGFWEAWRLPLVCRELRFGFRDRGIHPTRDLRGEARKLIMNPKSSAHKPRGIHCS